MTAPSNPSELTIIPLEALSEGELRALKRLKDLSQITGILLGAQRGAFGMWDLRPLIQTPHGTVIVRATDPERAVDSATKTNELSALRATLHAWKHSALCPSGWNWGEDLNSSQIWMARRWYEGLTRPTLNEAEFGQLVAELIAIHESGFAHGHLHGLNVVREGKQIKVLDPGFHFFFEPDATNHDPRALDLKALVDLAPLSLQARVQSAVTTGRLSSLTGGATAKKLTASPQDTKARNSTTKPAGLPHRASEIPAPWDAIKARFSTKAALQALVVLGVMTAIAGGIAWYRHEREIIPISEATQYLASGQPSLMSRVAEAAIQGQRSAQALIVQAANDGKIPESLVNRRLIRVGFDPRWEAQLGDADREMLLRLSLAKLYPEGLTDAPGFSEMHPGVLLAVIADVDPTKPVSFADEISLEGFATLPDEIGTGFKALMAAGITRVNDPGARALARIATGEGTEREVQAVLSGKGAGARLRALVPFFRTQPKLARTTLTFIASGNGVLTELLRWLGSDFSAGWSKAPPTTILEILAGAPPASLAVDQWADLLSFPEGSIRRSAAVYLSERFLKLETELVTLLASTDVGLTRSQTATLVSALVLPAEERFTLLSRLFSSGPKPEALKMILLVRGAAPANDPFNLESARALSNAQIPFSNPELRRLTQFKEPLVRAIAYSRLTAEDPEQLKILEECAQQEPDQKLRNGLLERLSEYTRTKSALAK